MLDAHVQLAPACDIDLVFQLIEKLVRLIRFLLLKLDFLNNFDSDNSVIGKISRFVKFTSVCDEWRTFVNIILLVYPDPVKFFKEFFVRLYVMRRPFDCTISL